MTSELEKTFFDTFGIEPKKEYYCPSCDTKLEEWKTEKGLYYMCGNCCECDYVLDSLDEEFEEILKNLSYRTEYPQISDRILLEFICMANQHEDYPISTNIKNIQARTLRILLRTEKFYKNYYGNDKRYKKLVNQVRTLFEEER